MATVSAEGDDDEYEKLARLDIAGLEETALRALKEGRQQDADGHYTAALKLDSANGLLLAGRAAVRIALGEPHAGRALWVPVWRVVFKRIAIRKDTTTDASGDPNGKITQCLRFNQTIRVDGEPVDGWLKLLDRGGYCMMESLKVGRLLERVVEGPEALNQALLDSERAIALQPQLAEPYLVAARCLSVQGDLSKAEDMLRRGLDAVRPKQRQKIEVQLRNLEKVMPKLAEASDLVSPELEGADDGKRAMSILKEASRLGAPALKLRPLLLRALLQARAFNRASEAKKLSVELLEGAIGSPSPEVRLWHGASLLLNCEQTEAASALRNLVEEAEAAGCKGLPGSGAPFTPPNRNTVEWFEVMFKMVLVKKRPDEKAPSWGMLKKGHRFMVKSRRDQDEKDRQWVELTYFELCRVNADCKDQSSYMARGFIMIDGADFGLGLLVRGPLPAYDGSAARTAARLIKPLDDMPRLTQQGDEHLSKGCWKDALSCYKTNFRIASWNKELLAELHVKIATVLRELDERDQAGHHVSCAMALLESDQRAKALMVRGILHFDAGRWHDSLKDLEMARSLSKRDVLTGPKLRHLEGWLKRAKNAMAREKETGKSKNYYAVLGLPCDCDATAVKQRFRKLALECHPDKVHTSSEVLKKSAEARFKAINEAYEVLSDVLKRKEYDYGW